MAAPDVKVRISAVDETKSAFDSVAKGAAGLKNAIFSVQAAIIAATAGFAYLVKQQLEVADSTSKMAQSAGVSVETLSGLGYAADLAGVSSETLGKSFGKLAKNLADANMGTGDAVDAFAALGINIKDSNGQLKSVDAVMFEVADKFANFADGTNKTAIAMKIFGKQGMDLIPMLNAGSAGLKEMQSEAEELGQVLSTETAQAAEEFNDTLRRIQLTQTGFINKIAAEFLPTLQVMATTFFEFSKQTDASRIIAKALTVLFQTLAVVGSDIIFVFKQTGNEIGGIAAQLGALLRLDFGGFSAISDAMKKDAAKARAELDAFQAKVMAIGEQPFAGAGRGFVNPELPKLPKPEAPVLIDVDKLKKEQDKIQAEYIKGWVAFAEAVIAEDADIEAQMTEITRKELEQRDADRKSMYQSWFSWIDKEQEEAIAAGELIVQMADEERQKIEDIANAIGSSFESAFTAAIQGGQGLGNVFKSLIKDLVAMTTKMLVLDPLLKSLRNAIAGSSFGQSVIATLGNLPGKANGGLVSANSPYMVGERGPELFIPHSSGTIVPNGESGGISINQVINVTTGVQQTVRAEIMSLMPMIASSAKAAVADAKLRGGSFAMAMR
jgi:hypothetical protein